MNKRTFLSSLAATAALSACGKRRGGLDDTASSGPATLHLYMWADYVKPSLVEQLANTSNPGSSARTSSRCPRRCT